MTCGTVPPSVTPPGWGRGGAGLFHSEGQRRGPPRPPVLQKGKRDLLQRRPRCPHGELSPGAPLTFPDQPQGEASERNTPDAGLYATVKVTEMSALDDTHSGEMKPALYDATYCHRLCRGHVPTPQEPHTVEPASRSRPRGACPAAACAASHCERTPPTVTAQDSMARYRSFRLEL